MCVCVCVCDLTGGGGISLNNQGEKAVHHRKSISEEGREGGGVVKRKRLTADDAMHVRENNNKTQSARQQTHYNASHTCGNRDIRACVCVRVCQQVTMQSQNYTR